MSENKLIRTPITEKITKELKAGDYVYLTGTIYVARDAAHKRMIESLDNGQKLPIEIKDSTIYYMGPSPAREGRPIGSGALISKCITKSEIVSYKDLGAEAILQIDIENFPVIVIIDSEGNNLYETAAEKFCVSN